MKPRWLGLGVVAMVGCWAVLGCGKKTGPTTPQPEILFTPDSVQAIFDVSCARSGCHTGPSAAGGMNLSRGNSYAALVNVPSTACTGLMRVRPHQPDSSCLVKRVTGEVTPRMPIAGTLTAEQIATLSSWVQAGAPSQPPVVAARELTGRW